VKAMAAHKRFKIDLDTLKDIYGCLAPDEVENKKPPQYRKDMPLHRLYFHEIATPDKISYKLRQFIDWVNAQETRRTTHVLRLAAKAHFQLLHIYPFPKHSGKIARLVMNLILLNGGYPPAVIHSTERQRYYDALKTNENALAQVVREAMEASLESAIRYFEMHAPPPPVVKPARRAPARAASPSTPPAKASRPAAEARPARGAEKPAKATAAKPAAKPAAGEKPAAKDAKATTARSSGRTGTTRSAGTARSAPAAKTAASGRRR
jgi:Fic/DOC family